MGKKIEQIRKVCFNQQWQITCLPLITRGLSRLAGKSPIFSWFSQLQTSIHGGFPSHVLTTIKAVKAIEIRGVKNPARLGTASGWAGQRIHGISMDLPWFPHILVCFGGMNMHSSDLSVKSSFIQIYPVFWCENQCRRVKWPMAAQGFRSHRTQQLPATGGFNVRSKSPRSWIIPMWFGAPCLAWTVAARNPRKESQLEAVSICFLQESKISCKCSKSPLKTAQSGCLQAGP